MGATINVRAKMKDLSVAEQQMVEIAKSDFKQRAGADHG